MNFREGHDMRQQGKKEQIRGVCGLCLDENTLRESHIIPKFIYKWHKKTSVTGFLRSGENIQKRIQDGLKIYLLCENCEQLFSFWEKYFSENIFYPLISGKVDTVAYNKNFLKFCTSVAWRALKYFFKREEPCDFPRKFSKNLESSLHCWGGFMLGKRDNPGRHELYFINFSGSIEGNTRGMSNYINRYISRAIQIDVVFGQETAIVYVKIPSFLILGFVTINGSSKLRSTRVQVNGGKIEPKEITIISELWEYIQEKANVCLELKSSLSNGQKRIIEEAYRKKLDEVPATETFKALQRDVDLFGEREIFEERKVRV